MTNGPIDASQIPFPRGAKIFLAGCALVAVICFATVYVGIADYYEFKAKCNAAGGMVVTKSHICIVSPTIIPIEAD